MKTPSGSALFSCESLHRAWLACRRRKRGTPAALAFEIGLADELAGLERELHERSYRPRPAVRFATRRPKLREIVAADFGDRVVHHLLVGALEPDWERVFIHDSFACRRGKGTHAAVDRLERFVRSATAGGQRKAFFLQLDIKSFFMSIDREILFERLDRRLGLRFGLGRGVSPEEEMPAEYDHLRWLTRLLVFHDPLKGCKVRGDRGLLARVPVHKTLAGCAPGCGLPIGNLTSQFFANVYLDALDQFVKHELKARRYVRYVDDLVIVHEQRDQLVAWRERIERFLEERLKLELNEARTKLAPVSSGIDFLGYVIHPTHRLVRRRVVGNLRAALSKIEKETFGRGRDGVVVVRSGARTHDQLVAVMNSYLAHFKRANAHRLTKSLWRRYRWLGHLVGRTGGRLVRRDRPRRARGGLRRQHAWFERRVAGGVLLFEVGSHFELLGRQARDFGPLLCLQPIEPRPGFSHRAGFSQRHLMIYVRRALDQGLPVTVVRETSRPTGGIKERRIVARFFPRSRAEWFDEEGSES